MERVTEDLAAFLAEAQFGDLSEEAIWHAKRCLLDFLGASIGGSSMKRSRILANFVRDIGGAQEATVIGYPFRVPCPSAGLANGAMGHALQMDDTDWASIAHIGTEVIPAALAVAEKVGADGKELLSSVVLGYEGAMRIGAAVHPSHNSRGFSPNGTIGVFGAAIAAGKILGLGKHQMADAIGSAGMQSSGLEEFSYDGSMGSVLNTGHATQAGVISALLAQRGFTGSRTIIEGKSGFCRAYSDSWELAGIVAGLGDRYRITDIWFKRYPTCAYANAALDVILDLVVGHDVQQGDVEELCIKTYDVVEQALNNPEPSNATAAMLSLPYNAAVAVVRRQVTPREFTEECLLDGMVRATMKKVKIVVADEELNRLAEGRGRAAIVRIVCHDGTEYEGSIKSPKGDTLNPFTDEELFGKFEALTSPILDGERIDSIATMVRNLEEVETVRDLTRLLSFSHPLGE
ncbi:MAG TPA: MmgE/PrpD family protein [Anaerolineae bacterium]|nr:MmgE/PrpD family protein [Anaerolineae bacterium]